MKIKVKDMPYCQAAKIVPPARKKPKKQSAAFRLLLKTISKGELNAVGFTCRKINMDKLEKGTPMLVLMNHSSFIDLKIASVLLGEYPFNIVCTSDGFVGKEWLMRSLGCIPTSKFQSDLNLVRDMAYAIKTLKSSVLMYPEASYSFDGTATPLPAALGKCIKLLGAPVVMIRTYGAFARDPLYNNLQLRQVKVSADMEYILSPQDVKSTSAEDINALLKAKFTFDNFRWQQQNKIKIDEPFRADGLNRVLYKCAHCGSEGTMTGKGTKLSCTACGKTYELDEYGYIRAEKGETEFDHVPDWFAWQRQQVKKEIEQGTYCLEVPVTVAMLKDMKSIYRVGKGVLTHTKEGFHLVGCDGLLDVRQHPGACYSLYSDFFWYELSDIICIGSEGVLYYCLLEKGGDVVAKARLATEELYKLNACGINGCGS